MRIGTPEFDVVILGSGVAGLFLAVELADAGMSVCVVESASEIAPGASTKNEGMLHRGTYHSAGIPDDSAAMLVARRCAFGFDEVLRRVPSAVVEPSLRSFVLIREPGRIDEYRSRWQQADIPHRLISRSQLKTLVPEVDDPSLSAAFEVDDKSIDTRVLYRELVTQAQARGVHFLTEARLTRISPREGVAVFNSGTS